MVLGKVQPWRNMVVNRHHQRGDVYVGRPSSHGNPVVLGKPCPRCGVAHGRDAKAIECTAAILIERLAEPSYRAQVADLDGKVLECSCAPDWCHADLLVAYSEAYAERLAICEVEGVPEAAKIAHQSGVCAVWQSARDAIEKATRGQQSLEMPRIGSS